MRRPLPALALSFIAGILLGHSLLFFPAATVCLGLLLLAAVLRVKRLLSGVHLPVLLGILSGGLLAIFSLVHHPPDHYTTMPDLYGPHRTVMGRIASPLERDPDRTSFLLQLASIGNVKASGFLRVTLRGYPCPVGYGDRVTALGSLLEPRGFRNPGGFDYPAFLARQDVFAVLQGKCGPDLVIREPGRGSFRRIQDWRERIRQAFLRSTSGDASAVLQAMIVGEEGALTDDLRGRFMRAGVTHILSISGSHLGLVAILGFWCARQMLFLLPERRYLKLTMYLDANKTAAIIAVVPVAFYTFLAGGQVATVRSLIMILTASAVIVLDREQDLYSALALAALITLGYIPQALFDISFQLSYASVIAIAFFVRFWSNLVTRQPNRLRRMLADGVLLFFISAATTLVTGPLVARYFNQVSPVGVLANMIVVPYAGAIVVPIGLASGVLSLFTGGLPFPGVTQSVTDLFLSLVSFFSRFPLATVSLPAPSIPFLIGWYGTIVSGAVALAPRLLARVNPLESPSRASSATKSVLAVSAIVLILSCIVPWCFPPANRITFIDVGQGDSSLIETAAGGTILIDGGGTRDNRFDIGSRVLAPFLRNRHKGSLDLIVLSHPHPDHMNGLTTLLAAIPAREVWSSGLDANLPGYAEFLQAARASGAIIRSVRAGDRAHIRDAEITVLHPAASFHSHAGKGYASENDRSLVVRVQFGRQTALFPGDIHQAAEHALLGSDALLSCDIMKIPHHGSKTSSSERFVRTVHPRIAVASVGAGNVYRQPSEAVLAVYRNAHAEIHRTDRNGAVIVKERNGMLVTYNWADYLLRTIALDDIRSWPREEWENWRRLYVRTAEI